MGRRSEYGYMNFTPLPSDDAKSVRRYEKWRRSGPWWGVWIVLALLFAPLLITILK